MKRCKTSFWCHRFPTEMQTLKIINVKKTSPMRWRKANARISRDIHGYPLIPLISWESLRELCFPVAKATTFLVEIEAFWVIFVFTSFAFFCNLKPEINPFSKFTRFAQECPRMGIYFKWGFLDFLGDIRPGPYASHEVPLPLTRSTMRSESVALANGNGCNGVGWWVALFFSPC